MKKKTEIIRQFRQSIRRGTGKAYILFRDNPDIDFSHEIIKACIKNYAYDGQCENSRASYLYGLIKQSKMICEIKKHILDALQNEISDTWTLTQLFDLAKYFYLDGYQEAKEAIYERFYKKIIFGSDWVGAYEILEIDGLNGLIYIADKIGAAILEDPQNWQDDTLIREFDENNKGKNGIAELEKLSKVNKNIKAYLDSIKRTRANRKTFNIVDSWDDDILYDIQNYKLLSRLIKHRKITEEEKIRIARAFVSEKDINKRVKYLCVFTYLKFPLDSAIILTYAKKKKSPLKEYAIEALSFLHNNEIRMFALENVTRRRKSYLYTDILISNYKKGDAQILLDLIDGTNNEDYIEELARSYEKIYTQNLTKECRKPLEAVYRKMTCGNCRAKIVEALFNNDCLSNEIKEEMQFDSNQYVRNTLKQL